MARQPEVQYIRLYTRGSAAQQLEMTPPERRIPKTKLPKPKRQKAQVIRLDPVAICAILVAAVMLVLMVVGCVRLYQVQAQNARLESYVESLTAQNEALGESYASGYDLDEIREMADALGLVPVDEVQHVTIEIP